MVTHIWGERTGRVLRRAQTKAVPGNGKGSLQSHRMCTGLSVHRLKTFSIPAGSMQTTQGKMFTRKPFWGEVLQPQLPALLFAGNWLFPWERSWLRPKVCPCPGIPLWTTQFSTVSTVIPWSRGIQGVKDDSPPSKAAEHRVPCSSLWRVLC